MYGVCLTGACHCNVAGSAVASALFLTSMAGGVYSTGAAAVGEQTPAISLTAVAAAAAAAQQQSATGTAVPNPQASPRPSILQRKRAMDR